MLALLLIVVFACDKDEEPNEKLPEENYFIIGQDYYLTPNAYLTPVDTFYTYAISNLTFTDGELDAANATIKNYGQLLFIDINTPLSDTAFHGSFSKADNLRQAYTYSSVKLVLAEEGKQLTAKSGSIDFVYSDTAIQVNYSFVFDDNTIINGNYMGLFERNEDLLKSGNWIFDREVPVIY